MFKLWIDPNIHIDNNEVYGVGQCWWILRVQTFVIQELLDTATKHYEGLTASGGRYYQLFKLADK